MACTLTLFPLESDPLAEPYCKVIEASEMDSQMIIKEKFVNAVCRY